MKFKIDENLPGELVTDLRKFDHDADTVFDEALSGVIDPIVIEAALAEERILLTLDKGIANLQEYPLARHAGVVLFRPARSGRRAVLAFIRERLPDLRFAARSYCNSARVLLEGPALLHSRTKIVAQTRYSLAFATTSTAISTS